MIVTLQPRYDATGTLSVDVVLLGEPSLTRFPSFPSIEEARREVEAQGHEVAGVQLSLDGPSPGRDEVLG